MDFSNWPTSNVKSSPLPSNNLDFSSLLIPTSSSGNSTPNNSMYYPNGVSSQSINPSSKLLSDSSDDFVEFHTPSNTTNDFDFDFTPKPVTSTNTVKDHWNGGYLFPNSTPQPSPLVQPSPSYNPFGSLSPSNDSTSNSQASPLNNSFSPNNTFVGLNFSPTLTTNSTSTLITPTNTINTLNQVKNNDVFLGASPLTVTSSPMGSLGDILDRDDRGELDKKSNYFQKNRVDVNRRRTMASFSQPTAQPTIQSTKQSTIQPNSQSNNQIPKKSEQPSLMNNSVIHDNSTTSTSSGGKPKAIEIEWIADNSFLCIVDQCKVEKSILSKTVSFRISTKLVKPHPLLTEKFYQVRRTISDFEYLHQHLHRSQQFLILPPLPHKSISSELGSQYDQYCKNYQSFLIRLGRHPYFSNLPEVADFVTKTPEELAELKKVKHEYPSQYAPLSTGWFGGSKPNLKDDKLVIIYTQISEFKEILKKLKQSAELIRKNYSELNNSVLSFTEELKKIPISTLIKPESGAIVDKGFTTNFDNFAHSYCSQSERMATQTKINDNLFDQRVEIWIQYASVALETVERYASLEVAQTESQKQSDRRTERLNTHKNNIAKKPGSTSTDDQKTKELSDQLEQSEKGLSSLSTLYNSTRTSLFSELQLYDKYKTNEINSWMEFVGECQFSEMMQSMRLWSFFAPK